MNSTLENQTKQYRVKSKVSPVIYPALKVVSAITVFLALINNMFFDYYIPMDNFIAVLVTVISVYTCYACRYNIGFFIASLVIAYANYSIAVGVYLDPSIRPAALYDQFSERSLSITILCVLIFEVAVLWMLKGMVTDPKSVDSSDWSYVKNERNDIIAYCAMALYLLIVVLTFDFGEGGTRGSMSAITEYRLIILIIGCYYSARKRSMRFLWTMIVGVTSMLILLSGNRVDSIGNMIALIILWYPKFVTFKKILLALPVAIIAMTAIGVTRGGTISSDTISATIRGLADTKLVWDTATFAYIPSVSIVEATDQVDLAEKIRLIAEYIKYTLVGTTDMHSQNLIYYVNKWFDHYGGCITPAYFYMWFGYVGSLLFTALVFVYSKLYLKVPVTDRKTYKNDLKYVISIYFISSVCRWYCYGPNSLIRNMLMAVLIFTVVYAANSLITDKSKQKG